MIRLAATTLSFVFAASTFAQSVEITTYGAERSDASTSQHIDLRAELDGNNAIIRAENGQPGSMGYLQMSFRAVDMPLKFIGLDGWLLVDTPFASVPVQLDDAGAMKLAAPVIGTAFAANALKVHMQMIALEKTKSGVSLALSNGVKFDFSRSEDQKLTEDERRLQDAQDARGDQLTQDERARQDAQDAGGEQLTQDERARQDAQDARGDQLTQDERRQQEIQDQPDERQDAVDAR